MDAREKMIGRLAFDRLDAEGQRLRARKDAVAVHDGAQQTLLLSSTVQAVAARKPTKFEDQLRYFVDAEAAKRGLSAHPEKPEDPRVLARAHAEVSKLLTELTTALSGGLPTPELKSLTARLERAQERLERCLGHGHHG
jgi:hypothetical protein